MLEDVSNTKVGGQTRKDASPEAPSTSSSASLDDLYADL
jgi:hypothetical protein